MRIFDIITGFRITENLILMSQRERPGSSLQNHYSGVWKLSADLHSTLPVPVQRVSVQSCDLWQQQQKEGKWVE